MRVVAGASQTSPLAGEGQPIGASLQNRLVGGRVTLVIVITIFLVREHGPILALARATKVDGGLRGGSLGSNCVSGFRCDFGLVS